MQALKIWLYQHKRILSLFIAFFIFIATLFFYFTKTDTVKASKKAQNTHFTSTTYTSQTVEKKSDYSALTRKLKAKQMDESTFFIAFLLLSASFILYSFISKKKDNKHE